MFSAEGQPIERAGLGTGREGHGCGKVSIGQQEVRRAVTPCPCSPPPQVLVVAGGEDARSWYLATTEVLVAGSPAWALAGRLPSARQGLRGASLAGRLYMTGGVQLVLASDDYTAEILEFNIDNKWEAAPPMEEKRALHGLAPGPYSAVQRFCPGMVGL
jgi:hypothetical protein